MAQQLRSCEAGDGASPDDQIAGCTAVIRSGIANDKELAALFNYRGVAYKAKGDLDHAIADYTEAIRLDPNYAPRPTTAAASPTRRKAMSTRRSRITIRRSGSIPIRRRPSTTAATPISRSRATTAP